MTQSEPVITQGEFDSQNLAFWDARIGKYREYHRIFVDGIRAIMTATSDDFVQWSKPELLGYQRASLISISIPTQYCRMLERLICTLAFRLATCPMMVNAWSRH